MALSYYYTLLMSVFASACKHAMHEVEIPHEFVALLMIWPSHLALWCQSEKVLCLLIPCGGSFVKYVPTTVDHQMT